MNRKSKITIGTLLALALFVLLAFALVPTRVTIGLADGAGEWEHERSYRSYKVVSIHVAGVTEAVSTQTVSRVTLSGITEEIASITTSGGAGSNWPSNDYYIFKGDKLTTEGSSGEGFVEIVLEGY